MEAEGKRVAGLLLEAPFTNLSDEIREYPIAQVSIYLDKLRNQSLVHVLDKFVAVYNGWFLLAGDCSGKLGNCKFVLS